VVMVSRRNVRLAYPHSTSERFRTEQTIFGRKKEGLTYEYSDRLRQWDALKYQEGIELAEVSLTPQRSADYFEILLSHYYDKRVRIEHILASHSDGYAYWVFGFRFLRG